MASRGTLVGLAFLAAVFLLLPSIPSGPSFVALPPSPLPRAPALAGGSLGNSAATAVPSRGTGPAAATRAELLSLARASPSLGPSAMDPSTITWTNLTVPDLPQAVLGASMAYDASRGMDILFGGLDSANVAQNTTWGYFSGNGRWTNLTTTGAPPSRYAASMAYDVLSGDLVLYGGYSPAVPGGALGDCWVLPPVGTWTPCLPSSTSPPPRGDGTFVADPAMGGLLLYGGEIGSTNLNDTWLWSAGGGWSELQPTGNLPRALWGMEGTQLPGSEGVLLYGGISTSGGGDRFSYDTYVLSPSDNFRLVGVMPQPAGMTAGTGLGALAYLPAMGGVVLFGGAYAYDAYLATTYASEQTWFLPWNTTGGTTTGWVKLPVQNVSAEFDIASSYDPNIGAMLIFGGLPTTQAGISGALPVRTKFAQFSQPTNWTPALNDSSPPPLAFPAVAYDPSNGDVVLFGGATAIDAAQLTLNMTNATWVFAPDGTWSQEHPLNAPPALGGATLTYLPAPLDEFVLFGGFDDQRALNATWVYHIGGDWVNITSGNSPTGRTAQGVVVAPGTDTFYLFGGLTTCAPGLPTVVTSRFLDDTWEFSPTSGWTNITSGVTPGPRAGSLFAISASPGSAILAGGAGPATPGCSNRVNALNTTWSFNFTTQQWTPLSAPILDPAVVFGCGAYDTVEHEDLYAFGITGIFLLFVGYNNSVWRAGPNETFTLASWSPSGRAGGGQAEPAPLARAMTSCVYDAARGGTFVYGGIGSTNAGPYTILGDDWLLRDVRWNLSVSNGSVQTDQSFTIQASAIDPFGATAPRNVTLALSDLTGTLQPNRVTLVNGQGSVSAEVPRTDLSDVLEACGLGVCVNLSLSVQSVATELTLTPLAATFTAGAPQALTVRVLNQSGATVVTWNGTVSLGVPGGIVNPSNVTLVGGAARVDVSFPHAGTGFYLWGQAGGLAAREGPFTVQPSYLAVLNLTARPPTATAGSSVEVDAEGWDAYGNPISGRAVTLTDSLGDVSHINGTLVNGSVEFLFQLGSSAGADTLYATAGNVTTSASLKVVPAPVVPTSPPAATPTPQTPWYLVVLVASLFGLVTALIFASEVKRREQSRKGAGKGRPKSEGADAERGKEKMPSGFLAFIPAEEEEAEAGHTGEGSSESEQP